MLSGSLIRPSAIEPVRQRADDRIEQPGPVEAGEEARHRPGQEDQRLRDAAAAETAGRAAAPGSGRSRNWRSDRGAGPPQRVAAARGRSSSSPASVAEMLEADEAAAERVEQLHVAEGVGDAERQRHQHDGDDEDQRRRGVEIGLGIARNAVEQRPAVAAPRGRRWSSTKAIVRRFRCRLCVQAQGVCRHADRAGGRQLESAAYFLARNFCWALVR